MMKNITNHLSFEVKNTKKIHSGENETFMLFSRDNSFILKKYRQDRGFKMELEDEITLTRKLLDQEVLTSEFLDFKDGSFIKELGGFRYTLQACLRGQMFIRYDTDFSFLLGKSIKEFHQKTSKIEKQKDISDYTFKTLLDDRLDKIKSAPFLDKKTIDKILYFRKILKPEYECFLKRNPFQLIHFDIHPGNLIFTPEGPAFIDWEETGYAPPLLDLASPLCHFLKEKNKEELKEALLEGYGSKACKKDLAIVIMAKLFYYMSHLPQRLDILKDPRSIYERYLSYFENLALKDKI